MESQQKTAAKSPTSVPITRTSAFANLLQHKCARGGSAGLSGECAECSNKRESLQRSAVSNQLATAVPAIVDELLRSRGQPLARRTRASMAPRCSHARGHVPAHCDPPAE